MGQTVWGGRANDSAAGISWDWIEVTDGVIAITDPMMMITNLRLIGCEDEVLTAHDAAPHLNKLVHGLPWQTEVRRALEESRRDERRRPSDFILPRTRRHGSRGIGSRSSDFTPLGSDFTPLS